MRVFCLNKLKMGMIENPNQWNKSWVWKIIVLLKDKYQKL